MFIVVNLLPVVYILGTAIGLSFPIIQNAPRSVPDPKIQPLQQRTPAQLPTSKRFQSVRLLQKRFPSRGMFVKMTVPRALSNRPTKKTVFSSCETTASLFGAALHPTPTLSPWPLPPASQTRCTGPGTPPQGCIYVCDHGDMSDLFVVWGITVKIYRTAPVRYFLDIA